MEKFIYKRVSSLTAITPKLTQYAIRMGGNPETTSYVPTGADGDLFFPQTKDPELEREFNITMSDRVILFAARFIIFPVWMF